MKKSGVVAIVGRPNVGKSTLLNQVLQSQISIVTAKAQTTRERLFGIYTEKEGQIVFVDTPGIHKAREGGINAYMVDEAKQSLQEPDAIWYLLDPRSKPEHEQAVLELLEKNAHLPKTTLICLLLNKSDLSEYQTMGPILLNQMEKLLRDKGFIHVVPMNVSALRNLNLEALLSTTWNALPEGPFLFEDPEQVSDRPVRYFVGEKIREQLFLCLGDEVPYSCAVQIEKFDESGNMPRIEAVIFVERESQKGMVVGKGGAKIKEIGIAARSTIEEFIGGKVFLGLNVKILKDWTKNKEALKKLGYVV